MADKAHLQTDLKLEEMEKRLSAIYSEATAEIQKTADEYFSRFAKQDEAKRKLLEQGKITEDEYKKWRNGKIMYGKRFTEMKKQCAEQLLHVNETALAYVNGELPEVYALNYNALSGSVNGLEGYSFTMVDANTVRKLALEDKSLLPYKKIDPAKDIPWNIKKINSQVLQGIIQGESIPKISKRIINVQKMNKEAAVRSARTIVTSAENKGRLDSYIKAEEEGIILQKEWIATNDSRVRHSHAMLDGAVIDQDKYFANGLMFPGDPSGRPEEVYNCRCTMAARVKGFRKINSTQNKNPSSNSLISELESGIIKLDDIVIGRSVGAKASNYSAMDLDTGEYFKFVEGTKIQNPEVFAGKGTNKELKIAEKYANKYGGAPEDWQHVKGYGVLETEDGDRKAEVHWMQCEGIGKYDFFVKEWLE